MVGQQAVQQYYWIAQLNYDRCCIRIINGLWLVYLRSTWWIPVRSMIRCVYVSVSCKQTVVTFLLLVFCCSFIYIYIFLFAQFAKILHSVSLYVRLYTSFFYNFVLLIDSVSYRAHTVHTNQALTNKMLQFFTSVRRRKKNRTNWQLNTIFALDRRDVYNLHKISVILVAKIGLFWKINFN